MTDYFSLKILNIIPIGVCAIKKKTEAIFINKALQKMFKIESENNYFDSFDYLPKDFLKSLAAKNVDLNSPTKRLEVEAYAFINDKKNWYKVTVLPILEKDIRCLLIIEDLTVYRQYYDDEVYECNFLKGVVNTLPLCIYWLDKDLAIKGYNDCLSLELDLHEKGKLIGKKITEIDSVSKDLNKTNKESAAIISGTKKRINKIVSIDTKKGKNRYIREQKLPIIFDDKIAGLLASFEDITDIKQAEENALRAKSLLATILNNIPNGVFVINADFEVDDYNLSIARLFDTEDLEVFKNKQISQTPFKIFSKNGELENQKVLDGVPVLNQTITIKINDQKRYFNYNKVPYIINNKIVGIVASTADITYELEKKKHLEHMLNSITNMLDSINLGIIWLDKEQIIVGVNKRIKDNLELKTDFIGKNINELLDLIGIDDDTYTENQKILSQEIGAVQKRMVIDFQGKKIYYEQSKLAIHNEYGEIQGLAIILKDITGEIRQAEDLKKALDKLNAVLDTSPNPIYWKDESLRYVGVNKAYENTFSKKKESLIGLKDSEINFQNSKYAHLEHEALKSDDVVEKFIQIKRKIFKINIARMKRNDQVTGIMAVLNDVTQERKNHDKLEYTSYHDRLTDLFNRSYFEKIKLKLGNSEILPISVVMIDVNGLKLMNDAFGHASGDKLLKCIAKKIKLHFKKGIVSRIGGDEFSVLLPKVNYMTAISMAENLDFDLQDTKVKGLTVSISRGIATKERRDQLLTDVINLADAKMYSNKLTTKSKSRIKTINEILEEIYKEMPEEKVHSLKVSYYAYRIAKEYGFDEKEANLIKDIGKYHDIGKIGIDRKLLVKRAKLTKADWVELKRHSEIGYAILNTSDKFVLYAKTVLNHHERYDGTGYPEGLSSNNIPIYSRIIAVADAVSSMSEDHTYRKKFSLQKIIDELRINSATQFDPLFAELAIKILEVEGLDFNEKE